MTLVYAAMTTRLTTRQTTRSAHRRLRSLSTALLVAALTTAADARVLSLPGSPAVGARLSTGDADGDGRTDLAVAGAGRVDWLPEGGQPVAATASTRDIVDIVHADLDGDGHDEIVAARADGLGLLRLIDGSLVIGRGAVDDAVWRVAAADVDGDGADELAVVILQRDAVAEVPRSVVRLVDVDAGPTGLGLYTLDEVELSAHVGDLCFVSTDSGPLLVVETGAEEVGGRLRTWEARGGHLRAPRTLQVGGDDLRILSLSAVAAGSLSLLSLVDVSGRVRVVDWAGGILRPGILRAGIEAPVPGGSAVLGAVDRHGAQMWIAPRRDGESLQWWAPVTGPSTD
jgi:hypothetical protein